MVQHPPVHVVISPLPGLLTESGPGGPCCLITTQDPDSGVRDLDTLRTIISYRGLREGKHADFGVLGEVTQPGTIQLGDEVTPLGD